MDLASFLIFHSLFNFSFLSVSRFCWLFPRLTRSHWRICTHYLFWESNLYFFLVCRSYFSSTRGNYEEFDNRKLMSRTMIWKDFMPWKSSKKKLSLLYHRQQKGFSWWRNAVWVQFNLCWLYWAGKILMRLNQERISIGMKLNSYPFHCFYLCRRCWWIV